MCAYLDNNQSAKPIKAISVRQKIGLAALRTIGEHYCFPSQVAAVFNFLEITDWHVYFITVAISLNFFFIVEN